MKWPWVKRRDLEHLQDIITRASKDRVQAQFDAERADAVVSAEISRLECQLKSLAFESAMAYGRQPGEEQATFLARREIDLDAVRQHPGSKAILNLLLEAENDSHDQWLSEQDGAAAERLRLRASVARELRQRILLALNTKRVREAATEKQGAAQGAEQRRFEEWLKKSDKAP